MYNPEVELRCRGGGVRKKKKKKEEKVAEVQRAELLNGRKIVGIKKVVKLMYEPRLLDRS